VLLVPGFTGSKEDFIAVLAPIAAAGHPVVAVDQRGQFESVEPGPDGEDPASYDATVLAEDVVALAAALGAGDRVHLVGHSFGGIVARAAVAAAPSRWVSLTLMSSGPGPVPHPAAENLGLLAKVLPDLDLATVWAAKAQLEAQAGVAPDPPETEAFLRRRFLANSPVALRRLADQLLSAPDSTYGIETLSLRVLVLPSRRPTTPDVSAPSTSSSRAPGTPPPPTHRRRPPRLSRRSGRRRVSLPRAGQRAGRPCRARAGRPGRVRGQ
jgi:pimeloyl-ACP methyl ester carboxylesterase